MSSLIIKPMKKIALVKVTYSYATLTEGQRNTLVE
jgi:hypothetical protein